MSDEDQNEFFFLCELNDEDPEVSSQDKNNIELIEEAEVKDCNDEKKKKRKKEKNFGVQQEFNDFEEDENKDEDEDKNDSHSNLENFLPKVDFMDNICQNDETKDIKLFSRKTFRKDSNDNSSFEENSNFKKVSRK